MCYKLVNVWFSVSQKSHARIFFHSFFPVRFVAKRNILQQKCERTNRNFPARKMLVQILALCNNPEIRHNALRHRQTDERTDRRTDDVMMPIKHRLSNSVAVE